METIELKDIKNFLPYFLKYKRVWADYDEKADILYIHFKKPNHADNSEMTDDDIIIRYEKGEVIGLSVLNANKRSSKLV
ncbi:MAG: DUF2283 domain-containing protein [Bacteroidales bacterium]|nr:DUF2283 domain-containing protein [Bacteroidales bacterium]